MLRAVEERNVKLVRLWFTDVLGQLKSVAISPVELETAFEEGVHFDGSAIDGFSRLALELHHERDDAMGKYLQRVRAGGADRPVLEQPGGVRVRCVLRDRLPGVAPFGRRYRSSVS